MTTSLAELLTLVQTLGTRDVTYSVAKATVTATVAGDPLVVAELDEQTATFRWVAQKPTSRTPSFEAGGIYNTAKRGGLLGHRPSQLRVKAVLAELFTSNGWVRTR